MTQTEERYLDWKEYENTARGLVAEGCVLLNNEGGLPLQEGSRIALFGRIQTHYYKSGTGSGGMVNVTEVIGIREALRGCDRVTLDAELLDIYDRFEEDHPFDEGLGWGSEPWSQEEMEVSPEMAAEFSAKNDVAVVILGRTAGEDKDFTDTPGSYRLTETEERMLKAVRGAFSKMVVLLNIAGLMDLSLVETIKPNATMIVWTGGMVGGLGTLDVLLGDVTPSGHLTDTVSREISDVYADRNFGGREKAVYQEDIYVGYRYFETFAPEKVRYPFGYGLTFTTFSMNATELAWEYNGDLSLTVEVTNVGDKSGRAVPQIYLKAPQGALGKPERVLIGFEKTEELQPGENQIFSFSIPGKVFASYDDSGVTGVRSAFVLEKGEYIVYLGENVRDAQPVGSFEIPATLVVEQLEEALAPVEAFDRIRPVDGRIGFEPVPVATQDMDERRKMRLPIELTEENAKDEAERLAAGMTDEELVCIVRGEGMGSSLVTPGTASAFGGVSPSLRNRVGLAAVCCSDGPSGMRMDCGTKAFSLPGGMCLAATFHPELVQSLYAMTGLEMIDNKVECLLGPGMNIHRHPLNGRNFEYFSEDPYLTGVMAGAMIRGLRSSGVTGVAKHFCGNNQETARHTVDTIVSERALREIYLRGFEMVVKEAGANAIMTTYGRVNGLWTAGSYDLNTTILREQWGFSGVVMTDWWANINERGKAADRSNFGAMIRSQNDLYMVCPDGSSNAGGDRMAENYADGLVTKGEMQRTAANVIRFVLETEAQKRKLSVGTKVLVEGRPVDEEAVDMDSLEFIQLTGELEIPLNTKPMKKGTTFVLPMEVCKPGTYEITMVASSTKSDLAQMPCSLFFQGYPVVSFVFHGSEGKDVEIDRQWGLLERFSVMRLVIGAGGLDAKALRFRFLHEGRPEMD